MGERASNGISRAKDGAVKAWDMVKLYIEDTPEFINRTNRSVTNGLEKLKNMDGSTADSLRKCSLIGALALDNFVFSPNFIQTTVAALGLLASNSLIEGYRSYKKVKNFGLEETIEKLREPTESKIDNWTFSLKAFWDNFTSTKFRADAAGFDNSDEAKEKRRVSEWVFGAPLGYFAVSNALINVGPRFEGIKTFLDNNSGKLIAATALAATAGLVGAIKSIGSGIKYRKR